MKNMKVSMKLMVSFLIVILLTVVIGAAGIIGMNYINKGASDVYDYNVVPIGALADIREILGAHRSDTRTILLYMATGETEKIPAFFNSMAANDRLAEEAFNTYESAILPGDDESVYFAAKDIWHGGYASFKKEFQTLVNAGDFDGAYKAFINAGAFITPMTDGFVSGSNANDAEALQANLTMDKLYATLLTVMIVMLLAALVVALFLAFYISGLISKPLAVLTAFMKKAGSTGDIVLRPEDMEMIGKFAQTQDEIGETIGATASFVQHVTKVSNALETIAGGDLTISVNLLSESDTMGLSLKTMLGNMNNMFTEINTATEQVSAGSKQIADGATALAAGSTEQASSVQELAASLNEVSTSTNQNASMAKEASNLSSHIKTSAEKGSVQMDQMMQAVTDINEASSSISKVIKVIDDIAFQTNILALNAAVEAARAGQHGKGFAVVAEEVRNLASKSAEAAKDTGVLIENSVEKANFGMSIATETSESLNEIVEGINHNAEIIVKIEQSSQDQARAITQINVGIDQVAQVVQQNSATAEESAAASEELSGQSDMLKQLIRQFKLK